MRNANSRFSENPAKIDIARSKFTIPFDHKLSFNCSELVPFYCKSVLPGDTFNVDDSKVIRMSTPLTPLMDNIFLDTYYFFVPNRLVWSHFKEFMGESHTAWLPQVEYTEPQMLSPATTGWNIGTIADHLGMPVGVPGLSVSALPFRAYALICNEWFRSENLTDEIYIYDGDLDTQGTNGTDDVDVAKGGAPFKVAKFFDAFTSALPAPQRGPDVMLPLGDVAPVVSLPETHTERIGNAVHIVNPATGLPYSDDTNHRWGLFANGDTGDDLGSGMVFGQTAVTGDKYFTFDNLWTALDQATAASINQLRLAFQLQKLFEADARGGSRYIEQILVHFGVHSPDARLQRPEYLGGSRKQINITQVVQSSESGSTPQGHTAAYSCTIDNEHAFTKSFVEHGWLIGVMCVRYTHTYQQGIPKDFSRKTKYDYYWPEFANIGEQAILNKEIFAQGSSVTDPDTGEVVDEQVFGYNEAWYEYRYQPSMVSGYMRSAAATSLDMWHLADDYASLPHLSDAWIREDKGNLDRALAVTSAVSHQFYGDIHVKNEAVRPMPVWSIPGLIDHH